MNNRTKWIELGYEQMINDLTKQGFDDEDIEQILTHAEMHAALVNAQLERNSSVVH